MVNLIRYIDVNGDRTAALVEIEGSKYFGISHLILLPYESGVGPEYFEITNNDKDIIPLFVKDNTGELHIISSFNKDVKDVDKGSKLVYLGKPFKIK